VVDILLEPLEHIQDTVLQQAGHRQLEAQEVRMDLLFKEGVFLVMGNLVVADGLEVGQETEIMHVLVQVVVVTLET
jgi:hypothetical protein